LGATGSIGLNTLDVIGQHPERYSVFALTAFASEKSLFSLCKKYLPAFAVMVDADAAEKLERKIKSENLDITVLSGAESLITVSAHERVDIVMAAIVGGAGLRANLAAAEAGKKILLANKESLVMSGQLFMNKVTENSATLLPIDSEHNAIFQCLSDEYRCGSNLGRDITRVLLTASGGPFRSWSYEQMKSVTPEQACAHPNWNMGQKISVDSASLMNKGLELIEACWLFNLEPDKVEVHVHPESIVHSMVEYIDGSVISQMGNPDMRTPIAYGLAWPERISSGVDSLDLFKVGRLNFEQPDLERFPCLRLAQEAFSAGGTSCAILNAANECAVESFLKGNIAFTSIPDIISGVLGSMPFSSADTIETILSADSDARLIADEIIQKELGK